jgi:sialic acid synthase SpsE
MLKKLELSHADHLELIEHCAKNSVTFLSTPFDLESIDLLKELGIKLGKIPSGEITNLLYLEKMAASFEDLILSTGMADMKEIEEAIGVITAKGFPMERLTVLHCTTEYPTPFEEVNLRAMQTIEDAFGVRTGYSDHTQGIEVPVAAVALGACLIEKHFTLDRNMEGPDHKASLEPGELKAMVSSIRNLEKAMGNGVKVGSPSEMKNKQIARKSIVASQNLEAGRILTLADLAVKRPGNGISPMLIKSLVGKVLQKPVQEDELLTYEHFKA